MVHNTVSKPLGLVLIVTVHMVFNGVRGRRGSRLTRAVTTTWQRYSQRADPIPAEVTGRLGTNITFQFTFNVSVTKIFAVYTTNHAKIAEYSEGNRRGREGDFDVHPKNTSVICHITNLKLHHSGIYWASLLDTGLAIASNNKVQLIVQEENRTNTVPPMATDITIVDSGSPSFFSTHIVTVLVVSPVVLLAALLPLLIWCLVRTKDKQPPHQQRSSNPTVQETVEASNNVPPTPLVYSILDFPKRSPAVLEINPSDTEYAAVSYLPEKRQV